MAKKLKRTEFMGIKKYKVTGKERAMGLYDIHPVKLGRKVKTRRVRPGQVVLY